MAGEARCVCAPGGGAEGGSITSWQLLLVAVCVFTSQRVCRLRRDDRQRICELLVQKTNKILMISFTLKFKPKEKGQKQIGYELVLINLPAHGGRLAEGLHPSVNVRVESRTHSARRWPRWTSSMAWPIHVLETTLEDTPDGFAAFTRDFIAPSAPALLPESCTHWPAFELWSTDPSSPPQGLRRPELAARRVTVLVADADGVPAQDDTGGGSGAGSVGGKGASSARADASVVGGHERVIMFSGDPSMRQSVSLDFQSLCDVAHACEQATAQQHDDDNTGPGVHVRGPPHRLVAESGLAFYLSQCPITGGSSSDDANSDGDCDGRLPELTDDIVVPTALRKLATAVNLWVGTARSVSNTHFDASNNLLYVVRGAKRVWLSPPGATDDFEPHPVWKAGCFNHVISRVDTTPCAHGAVQEGGDCCRTDAAASVVVEVRAGAGLFIPEGWWHTVESAPGTVAVNVWWPGAVAELTLRVGEQRSPSVGVELYLARCALALAVDVARRNAADMKQEQVLGSGRVMGGDVNLARLDDAERVAWLRAASWADHERLLPSYAARHPDDWERTLVGVDPATAEIVLGTWERVCAPPSFFAAIMDEPLGEERSTLVKSSLRAARDLFARQAFEDVLRQMGWPPSAS